MVALQTGKLFNVLLQENDMKRSRAIKKTKDEEDLARQKEREISRYVLCFIKCIKSIQRLICLGFVSEKSFVSFTYLLYNWCLLYSGKFWREKILANLAICYESGKVLSANCL